MNTCDAQRWAALPEQQRHAVVEAGGIEVLVDGLRAHEASPRVALRALAAVEAVCAPTTKSTHAIERNVALAEAEGRPLGEHGVRELRTAVATLSNLVARSSAAECMRAALADGRFAELASGPNGAPSRTSLVLLVELCTYFCPAVDQPQKRLA
eukprot:m51a1_g449 hypothetical protein (154) ;mRNA; r:125947-127418